MTGQRKELFIIKEFKNKGNTNERKVWRYHRGHQKIPHRQSEDTIEAIKRYHRGNQKKPQRQSEDTTEVIRRNHRGNQKIPQRQSEVEKTMDKKTIIHKTLHRKLNIEQKTNPTKDRGELMCTGRKSSFCSTGGTRLVTLDINKVIRYERETGVGILWLRQNEHIRFHL